MESEKAELYSFFLINKTKKYEAADFENRLVTTVQKMARTPIERFKAILAVQSAFIFCGSIFLSNDLGLCWLL